MINLKHESQKNKIIMISIVVIILAAYVYLFTSAKTISVPLTKQSEVTKLNDDPPPSVRVGSTRTNPPGAAGARRQIGRASCRERV